MKKTITIEVEANDEFQINNFLLLITEQIINGNREGFYNGELFSYNYTVVTE